MATTQKRKRGPAVKSTGKRAPASSASASARKKSSSVHSGQGRKKAAAAPIRREVGAAVCLVLALFTAFGYFDIKALFIDLLCGLFKGLVGYGFFLVPPALVLAFYILCFHRGRPVRLRLTSALLMPLFLSILLHLFLGENYAWGKDLIAGLWKDGLALRGGGLLGGFFAIGGRQVCSVPGTVILIVVALVVLAPIAFNRSIVELFVYLRERPRVEYEPEEESVEEQPLRPTPRERMPKPRFQDVPLDGEEPKPAKAEEAVAVDPAPAQSKKKSFFNRKPNVLTPDEVLTGKRAEQEEPAEPEVPVEQVSMSEPVEKMEAPVEQVVADPAVAKVTRDEAVQAAAEVAKEIEQVAEQASEQDRKPYQYPPISLLNEGTGGNAADGMDELAANRQRLNDTIHSFGIDASIINTVRGPSVTRYELELDQGVRLNKLTNLADDIALALGATGVRIAPIPDKISVVGIEVPNKIVSPVSAHAVIGSNEFTGSRSKISFAVGKDISGNCVVGDIGKLPHLLIAGTTGSGKSVCTNTIITSLLYKATPDEVRLIMVDPKMVELGIYNGIPHLLIPVVTDPKKAAGALQWAVTEMMKRYRTFSEVGVRKLEEYNALAAKNPDMDKMPAVVVIIDELADLMLVAAKEVEESICRVAQMGRAAGMHLVIATQRPSADVITGLMKANIPSRIAFAVASAMESRIILDTMGAEKLVGRGDMLFAPLGSGKPTRVQGCFISDEEVARVVDFVKQSGSANYSDEVIHEIEQHVAEKEKTAKGIGGSAPGEAVDEGFDELLSAAIEVVIETGQASVSMLQRRLKLGYARAARLVDQMEEKGVVGPFEGSKPRQLLITKEQWQEMQYRQNMPAPAPGEESTSDEPPFDVEADLEISAEDSL